MKIEKIDALTAFLKHNLPRGVSVDMFYIAVTIVMVAVCAFVIYKMVGKKTNKMSSRIKAIHERRKELYTGLLASKKRKKPEGSINFMRMVSMKF